MMVDNKEIKISRNESMTPTLNNQMHMWICPFDLLIFILNKIAHFISELGPWLA